MKNNTYFDIDWLRQKGFVGNCDTGDEVERARPRKIRNIPLSGINGLRRL